jgi:hypothetical protein
VDARIWWRSDANDESLAPSDLYGVNIPAGVKRVTVRARHKPKGYDGATLSVALPRQGE